MPRQIKHGANILSPGESPRRSCLFLDLERRAYPLFDPKERRQDRIWLLDYFYDPGLKIRVGSPSAPWRERPENVARLYSPGAVYWQDSTHCKKPLLGAWLTFCAINDAALLTFTDRDGIAEFDDPEGVLGALLTAMAASVKRALGGSISWRDLNQMDPVVALIHQAVPIGEGHYRILRTGSGATSNVLVARVDAYIRDHFNESMTRDEMARSIGVSVSKLAHDYRALTGRSPMVSLQVLRVKAAAHLIEQGAEFKAVADATGFCEAAHLSRVFKQFLGISPAQFRKLCQERDLRDAARRPTAGQVVSTLFGAVRMERNSLDVGKCEICSNWTLDAFLTPGVRHRFGSESAPWLDEGRDELWLYSPGCAYWEDSTSAEKPIISYSIRFHIMPGSPLLRKAGWPSCLRFRDPNRLISPLMERLTTLAGEHSFDDIRKSEEILQQILWLLSRAAPTGPGVFSVGAASTDPAVIRVMHFLEKHYHEPLTRNRIAREAGVGVSKLDRSCVLATGEHPMQLLRRIRMDKGKALLAEGRAVTDVAEATGFSDPQSFSHTFRRVEGISPRDYAVLQRVS